MFERRGCEGEVDCVAGRENGVTEQAATMLGMRYSLAAILLITLTDGAAISPLNIVVKFLLSRLSHIN